MWRGYLFALLVQPMLAEAQTAVVAEDLASSVGTTLAAAELSAFRSGVMALKNDRPQDAIAFLTRELAAHPENGKAWYYRGVCHMSTGETNAALSDLERALELMPNDANARLRRSEVNMTRKDLPAAIADLNTVLVLHPEGPIAEHALMSLGEARMRQGDPQTAIAVYDRFVALAPKDARSWFNRGMAHAHTNAHQQAYDDLSRAIALDGWMHRAYSARAIELVHLERKPEACTDLNRAKELGDTAVDDLLAIYCE